MAEVTIVPSPGTIKVKGGIGGAIPPLRASGPEGGAPTAEPPPKVSGLPDQRTATAAPVPPPVDPPKPSTTTAREKASDKIFKALRDRNKPAPAKPAAKEVDQPMPGEHLEEPQPSEEPAEGAEPSAEPAETGTPDPKTAEKGAKGKVNPWKLVDEWKQKTSDLEKQLLETKKLIKDETTAKLEAEQTAAIRKRNEELESEIKFVAYRQSKEFQEQYQQPLENGFKLAMEEISELPVTDPSSGEERKATAQDFWELTQLPIVQAKEKANELFGDFAEDVLRHRNEIVRLLKEQGRALERAKSEAVKVDEERKAAAEKTVKELHDFNLSNWEKLMQASLNDPENGEFFKPVDGNDERNTILTKGFELVDTAARQNPMDPSLTQDQRLAILRKHVAVRNRTAGYGVLKYELKKTRAELAEALKKLEQYQESVPGVGGSAGPAPSAAPSGKASEQVFSALRKLARH